MTFHTTQHFTKHVVFCEMPLCCVSFRAPVMYNVNRSVISCIRKETGLSFNNCSLWANWWWNKSTNQTHTFRLPKPSLHPRNWAQFQAKFPHCQWTRRRKHSSDWRHFCSEASHSNHFWFHSNCWSWLQQRDNFLNSLPLKWTDPENQLNQDPVQHREQASSDRGWGN